MISGGRYKGGRFAFTRRTLPDRNLWAAFAAGGQSPDIVADFVGGRYRGAGPLPAAFSDLFSFARTTSGTYTDASGVLQTAAAGVPRFDHALENGKWVNRGLLIENKSRANMLKWSGDFANAIWVKSRASVLSMAGSAPDGSVSASQLTSTASTYDGAVRQSAAYATGDTLTFSVYAKGGDRAYLFLRERTRGFAKDTYFNLASGTTGTVNSAHTAVMKAVGNGWYRCSITVTATQSATTDFEIYSSEDDFNTSSSQPGFIHIWGAQLELGEGPSSYIATQEVPVTRAADSVSAAGGALFDPLEAGAVSVAIAGWAQVVTNTGPVVVMDWSGPSGDGIEHRIETDAPSTGALRVENTSGGSVATVVSPAAEVGPGWDSAFAIASRHTPTEIGVASSGATVASVSSPGLPGLAGGTLSIGTGLMGHMAQLVAWRGDIGAMGLIEAAT